MIAPAGSHISFKTFPEIRLKISRNYEKQGKCVFVQKVFNFPESFVLTIQLFSPNEEQLLNYYEIPFAELHTIKDDCL